jgi:hypothetical protein
MSKDRKALTITTEKRQEKEEDKPSTKEAFALRKNTEAALNKLRRTKSQTFGYFVDSRDIVLR